VRARDLRESTAALRARALLRQRFERRSIHRETVLNAVAALSSDSPEDRRASLVAARMYDEQIGETRRPATSARSSASARDESRHRRVQSRALRVRKVPHGNEGFG